MNWIETEKQLPEEGARVWVLDEYGVVREVIFSTDSTKKNSWRPRPEFIFEDTEGHIEPYVDDREYNLYTKEQAPYWCYPEFPKDFVPKHDPDKY